MVITGDFLVCKRLSYRKVRWFFRELRSDFTWAWHLKIWGKHPMPLVYHHFPTKISIWEIDIHTIFRHQFCSLDLICFWSSYLSFYLGLSLSFHDLFCQLLHLQVICHCGWFERRTHLRWHPRTVWQGQEFRCLERCCVWYFMGEVHGEAQATSFQW